MSNNRGLRLTLRAPEAADESEQYLRRGGRCRQPFFSIGCRFQNLNGNQILLKISREMLGVGGGAKLRY